MKKLLRVGKKGRTKLEPEKRQMTDDLEIRVELIQALIPVGLQAVGGVLAQEVGQLAGPMGKSFKTTNCIESIMSLVGQRTDKVDYWKNSSQKQRWVVRP